MDRRHVIFLLLFGIIFYLTGNNLLPVTDPVESNYAETAREMIMSGDYLSPQIFNHYWYDKPIFFYWELVVAIKLFGFSDFALRFFPAIFAIAGLLLTYNFGSRLYGKTVGFMAAIILGTSIEYWYLGHAIITDMTLLVTISLCLINFFWGYQNNRPHLYYWSFAAAAIAVLDKGPIGLCLPGLIILIFLSVQRDLKALLNRHIAGGFLLFIFLTALWYGPMIYLHGSDFAAIFLGVHNVLRATVPEHPKTATWYFYLLIFIAGFFPWSIFLIKAFIKNLYQCIKARNYNIFPQTVAERFLIIWSLTVFVCFQIFATKYLTYTLPYMMPLAILFAKYFCSHLVAFRRLACLMAIFYLTAFVPLIVPQVAKHSQKAATTFLQEQVTNDTLTVTWKIHYPVSLVYYSGIFIKQLDTRAGIEQNRPHQMSWTATNVMPFQAIEDLPTDKDILLISEVDSAAIINQDLPGTWQLIGHCDKTYFYRQLTNLERKD